MAARCATTPCAERRDVRDRGDVYLGYRKRRSQRLYKRLQAVSEGNFCKDQRYREDSRSHSFRYAGTIDRIAEFKGPSIIDIMTSHMQDWHGIQLVAYKLALGVGDPKLYGLYLRKNGKYYLKEFNAKYYAEIFLTALEAYRWKCEKV